MLFLEQGVTLSIRGRIKLPLDSDAGVRVSSYDRFEPWWLLGSS